MNINGRTFGIGRIVFVIGVLILIGILLVRGSIDKLIELVYLVILAITTLFAW